MGNTNINWFDKTILALARFGFSKTMHYDIYTIKILMSVSFGLHILSVLGILKELGVITGSSVSIGLPSWSVVLALFALSYIPVHLMSHSAQTIFSGDLSRMERGIYTVVGFFLLGGWGLLLIWPVPMLLSS